MADAFTWDLSYDEENGTFILQHNNNGNITTLPGWPFLSPATPDNKSLYKSQRRINFIDCVKDGTPAATLVQLGLFLPLGLKDEYGRTSGWKPALEKYETNMLSTVVAELESHTWSNLKQDKIKKKMKPMLKTPLTFERVLWECGISPASFIVNSQGGTPSPNATYGSFLDPLEKTSSSKLGTSVVWPNRGDSMRIDNNAMRAFGFGKNSQIEIDTTPETPNGDWNSSIWLGLGVACTNPPCQKSGTEVDTFITGNKIKDAYIKDPNISTADKIMYILVKELGDKLQVIIYFIMIMWHLQNSGQGDIIMTTCDMVVYCLCITLKIPCIYTGVYKAFPGRVPAVDEKQYRIVHYKPVQSDPTPQLLDNWTLAIDKIKTENMAKIQLLTIINDNIENMDGFWIGNSFYAVTNIDHFHMMIEAMIADSNAINEEFIAETKNYPAEITNITNPIQLKTAIEDNLLTHRAEHMLQSLWIANDKRWPSIRLLQGIRKYTYNQKSNSPRPFLSTAIQSIYDNLIETGKRERTGVFGRSIEVGEQVLRGQAVTSVNHDSFALILLNAEIIEESTAPKAIMGATRGGAGLAAAEPNDDEAWQNAVDGLLFLNKVPKSDQALLVKKVLTNQEGNLVSTDNAAEELGDYQIEYIQQIAEIHPTQTISLKKYVYNILINNNETEFDPQGEDLEDVENITASEGVEELELGAVADRLLTNDRRNEIAGAIIVAIIEALDDTQLPEYNAPEFIYEKVEVDLDNLLITELEKWLTSLMKQGEEQEEFASYIGEDDEGKSQRLKEYAALQGLLKLGYMNGGGKKYKQQLVLNGGGDTPMFTIEDAYGWYMNKTRVVNADVFPGIPEFDLPDVVDKDNKSFNDYLNNIYIDLFNTDVDASDLLDNFKKQIAEQTQQAEQPLPKKINKDLEDGGKIPDYLPVPDLPSMPPAAAAAAGGKKRRKSKRRRRNKKKSVSKKHHKKHKKTKKSKKRKNKSKKM